MFKVDLAKDVSEFLWSLPRWQPVTRNFGGPEDDVVEANRPELTGFDANWCLCVFEPRLWLCEWEDVVGSPTGRRNHQYLKALKYEPKNENRIGIQWSTWVPQISKCCAILTDSWCDSFFLKKKQGFSVALSLFIRSRTLEWYNF